MLILIIKYYLYNDLGNYTPLSTFNSATNSLNTAINGKANTSELSKYATTAHVHSQYATTAHTHSQYSTTAHNHDSTYLKLNGGTMTGNLSIRKTASNYYLADSSTYALASSSNNGMSNDADIGGIIVRDKNGKNIGYFIAKMLSNGNNISEITSYNMTTSGSTYCNIFRVIANKNGSNTYYVSNPTNFRSAISAADKTVGFENKTAHGVQIRKYTTDLFIYITVVGTATSTCTNEVVYNLTSLQSQDNAVVPLTSYDDVNVHRGRLMYNEGKIKITISNAAYLQGYLIIPNR